MAGDWTPEECTLPTAERPLRVEEFDGLFAYAVDVTRSQPTLLNLVLPHSVEILGRELARRESQCCSFFRFGFEDRGKYVVMSINVPRENTDVLDALQARIDAS